MSERWEGVRTPWHPPTEASSWRSSRRTMEARVIFSVSELMFFAPAPNTDKADS